MDKYALFGNPVKHSKSPFIHTLFARQTMQNISYQAIEVELGHFQREIRHFFTDRNNKGCNVTAPFKEEAFNFADQLTKRAQLSGAVNTLKKLDDGIILGDNTDGAGLVQDFQQYQVPLQDKRILLIGAGGAARGVLLPLLEKQPTSITVTNRTHEKAEKLAGDFWDYGQINAKAMNKIDSVFDIIINATSSSFTGDIPDIDPIIFDKQSISYDMNYGTKQTIFSRWAMEQGVFQAYDGLGMLVGQAAESFAVWRGLRPGSRQILRELRKNLESNSLFG